MGDEKTVYECSEMIKTAGCGADNFDELILILEGQGEGLKAMKAAGVKMEADGGGHFTFTTEDFMVAKQFGMLPSDYWDRPEHYPEFNDAPSN
jgi:hypothetical protein